MSRVVTPTYPQTGTGTPGVSVPREKIASRAYEKWCKRGCVHGFDRQDWAEAEAELKVEFARASASTTTGSTTSSSAAQGAPAYRR